MWAEKLRKKDPKCRFKFGIFTFDNKDNELRMANLIEQLRSTLKMEKIEKLKLLSSVFSKDPTLYEIDCKGNLESLNSKGY